MSTKIYWKIEVYSTGGHHGLPIGWSQHPSNNFYSREALDVELKRNIERPYQDWTKVRIVKVSEEIEEEFSLVK